MHFHYQFQSSFMSVEVMKTLKYITLHIVILDIQISSISDRNNIQQCMYMVSHSYTKVSLDKRYVLVTVSKQTVKVFPLNFTAACYLQFYCNILTTNCLHNYITLERKQHLSSFIICLYLHLNFINRTTSTINEITVGSSLNNEGGLITELPTRQCILCLKSKANMMATFHIIYLMYIHG